MAGTPARFGRVATRALSGAGALSSFVATAGYLSFREATKPNLLSSFSDFDPSWSLPLALKLGEHFMSTSMVTLKLACSINRPASRLDDAAESVHGVYRAEITGPGSVTINIKIFTPPEVANTGPGF